MSQFTDTDFEFCKKLGELINAYKREGEYYAINLIQNDASNRNIVDVQAISDEAYVRVREELYAPDVVFSNRDFALEDHADELLDKLLRKLR